jgi:hypothetical protein
LEAEGLWIVVEPYITNSKVRYEYKIINITYSVEEDWVQEEYHTPHEALSSAFDYILDNLI